MTKYTAITILYNPKATGSGKLLAKALKSDLEKAGAEPKAVIQTTKTYGHAETLAYDLAKASERPLIISASGDGGYHEVVNGVMRAQSEGAAPTTGLLPAGSANDHYKAVHDENMLTAILKNKARRFDLLRLEYGDKVRYAHSYIGLGLTAGSGEALNIHRQRRSWLMDIWLVAKVLLFSGPVELRVNKELRRYDSLIFSNIGKMSKILSLSHVSRPTDGKFEITAMRHRPKLWFILHLAKSTTWGLRGKRQASTFTFTTTHRTLIQLDGEILTLPANTVATLTVAPKALRCIV